MKLNFFKKIFIKCLRNKQFHFISISNLMIVFSKNSPCYYQLKPTIVYTLPDVIFENLKIGKC